MVGELTAIVGKNLSKFHPHSMMNTAKEVGAASVRLVAFNAKVNLLHSPVKLTHR